MLTALQWQYSRSIGHTSYNTIAYCDDSQASVLRVQYMAKSKTDETDKALSEAVYFSGAGFLWGVNQSVYHPARSEERMQVGKSGKSRILSTRMFRDLNGDKPAS